MVEALDCRKLTTTSIPRTHISIEQEDDTPRVAQEASASNPTQEVSHSPFRKVHKGMWKSQKLPTKRRLETIVDDIPPSALAKRREQTSSCPPQRSRQQPTTAPSESKLKQLPPNAPRDIEKKGRYTFRKGVRIRDYQVPTAGDPPPMPSSVQFQCRDGFDGHEAFIAGFSRPMVKRSRDPQWREEQGPSSPFPTLPLTLRSTTPLTQSCPMSDALGNTEQVARPQGDPQSFEEEGEGHEAFKQWTRQLHGNL